MESAAERKSIYQELLTESFEHLVKQLPKSSKAAVQQLLGIELFSKKPKFHTSIIFYHSISHHQIHRPTQGRSGIKCE